MITVRRSSDRGRFEMGWLDTAHSFSFGRYYDPRHMGFRALRVINEDVIAPQRGFAEHPHQDMEILSYVLSGTLRHGDSLGHAEDLTPGAVQHMTAGSGIRHSEHNPSGEPTHMLQIWLEPREEGLSPRHETKRFPIHAQPGRLHVVASPDGAGGSLVLEQDARLLAGRFSAGDAETVALNTDRHGWVQVARGSVTLNGTKLNAGDGAAISDEPALELTFDEDAEVLVFDLA